MNLMKLKNFKSFNRLVLFHKINYLISKELYFVSLEVMFIKNIFISINIIIILIVLNKENKLLFILVVKEVIVVAILLKKFQNYLIVMKFKLLKFQKVKYK